MYKNKFFVKGIPKLPPNANETGLLPSLPELLMLAAPIIPEIKAEFFCSDFCANPFENIINNKIVNNNFILAPFFYTNVKLQNKFINR